MKIKCEIVMDLDSQQYDMSFYKVGSSADEIDYDVVEEFLGKVFKDWRYKVETSGINSDNNLKKMIH